MKNVEALYDFQFDQENVEELWQNCEWDSPEAHSGNDPFGLAAIFKEYAGLPLEYPLRLTMEHGLKFDDNDSWPAKRSPFKAILTPSRIRTPIVERESDMQSIPIGFGFLYAKALFKKFGFPPIPEESRRGTIVFPFKSTQRTTVHFDHAAYASLLQNLPERFHPIYVCVYWLDDFKGVSEIYRKADIPVVSVGHRFDPLFFHRFYDLCRQFRYAASNDLGTHHFIAVESGCRFFYVSGLEMRREVKPARKPIDDRTGDTYERTRAQALSLFSEALEETTSKQKAYVDAFLGVDCFVSPRQLRHILLREHRYLEGLPWWVSQRRLLSPPEAHDFSWNELAPSSGWHYLEKDGATTIRWMGRTTDAWLDLHYSKKHKKHTAILKCLIHSIVSEDLEISVNDERITELRRIENGNGFWLEGQVPSATLMKHPVKNTVRIGFHIPDQPSPCKTAPKNPKKRRLGAAISSISLNPIN